MDNNEKSVYIETYGCSANKNDSEIMVGLLEKSNYTITSFQDAKYVIINTCGVKNPTEEKVIERLRNISNQDKKIIISGCLTRINLQRIKKIVPNFSAILDTKSIDKIVEIVKHVQDEDRLEVYSQLPPDKPSLPNFSFNPIISILQVSEGCLSNCSFCGTKLSRGNLISYRPESIRDSIKILLNNGSKEIWLTSQDMSAYGRDIQTNLSNLLESITKIDGNFFIRIGMMNPLHFKRVEIRDLIEVYKSEKIFKFLHLCVQSGSNMTLEKMKRGYTVDEFIYYVELFRTVFPQMTLVTDIIAGFPGETEEDFEKSMEIIRKSRPDFVNVSRYGSRPGTSAAKMKQLPTEVVKERCKRLSDLVVKISMEKNREWIGWKGQAIVDEFKREKGNWTARNFAYKPIILKGEFSLGQIVDVEIVDANRSLIGDIRTEDTA